MSKALAFGGASLALSSAVMASLAPGAALAAPSCGAGATLVSAGVCEIKFTSGTHTFTPPAGITKLDALVVGAGGAGAHSSYWYPTSYAGGGGDVKVVSLTTSGEVSVAVGHPGTHATAYSSANDSTVTQGASTTTSQGGRNADDTGPSGASGSGISGTDGYCVTYACVAGGAGAGARPSSSSVADYAKGGAGLVVNAISGASTTLFAEDTTCFGGGGGASTFGADNAGIGFVNGTATCGGGYGTLVSADGAYSSYTQALPLTNSGGGGGAIRYHNLVNTSSDVSVRQDGAAGLVTLRYNVPTLPNTGLNSPALASAAGLAGAGIIAGAVLIIAGLRRRKA